MADIKISQLPVLLNANASVGDAFPIVDSVAGETKQISLGQLDLRFSGVPTGGILNQVLSKASSTDKDVYWRTLDKNSVGLGLVDNTSDVNKPISSATQVALNLKANTSALASKADISYVTSQVATKQDQLPSGTNGYVLTLVSGVPAWAPGGGGGGGSIVSVFGRTGPIITAQTGDYNKTQVGLDQVDNTSDLDKPISNLTATALATKQPNLPTGTNGQILSLVAGVPAWVAPVAASPLTTKGDLYGFSTTNARVPVGTNGQLLAADSTSANGVSWIAPPVTSPLTSKGDIYAHNGTVGVRLPVGTDGQTLAADSTSANGLAWTDGALPKIFGLVSSPLTITAATGITVAGSAMSNTAAEQVIFVQGPTANDNVTLTAASPIDPHTKIGAKMWIMGTSDTQQLTFDNTKAGIEFNGNYTTTATSMLCLIWTGIAWRMGQ